MPIRLRLRTRLSDSKVLLAAPSGLSATVNLDRTVTLDWTDAPTDPNGYRVYRQAYDENGVLTGDQTLLDTVSSGVETFDDPFSFAAATIPLTASRLDGGSGATVTNNGILLPEGLLTSGQLSLVALWQNGAEIACYVAALEGTWSDGTLMSILLQASINTDSPGTLELRIGTSAAVARRVYDSGEVKVTPDAVLLPTDASDWIDSGVFPRTVSSADTPATFAAYSTVWTGWATARRAGASPLSHKWDRPMAAFGQLVRRGATAEGVASFKWACQNVAQIISEADALTPDGATAPQNASIECLPYHYWLTGFARSREYSGIYAQRFDRKDRKSVV